MEIPQLTPREEYQHLENAVTYFGVQHLARVIARRSGEAEGPFTILVAGPKHSGKSTILSVLAERPLPGTNLTGPWLNVYRPVPLQREGAEIHRTSRPGEPLQLSLEHATRFLTRASAHLEDIESVVWNVSMPEIPEGIVLAEASSGFTGDELDAQIWLADAVIWTIPTQQVSDPALGSIPELVKRRFTRDMPVVVVITHTDELSISQRNEFIQDARGESLAPFDRIVPFSLQYDGRGNLSDKAIAPVRVEVRTRLFRGARRHRNQSRESFLTAFRDALTEYFEQRVDTILDDRATCLEFDRLMQRRLDKIFGLARHRLTEIVPIEADQLAAAEGIRLQRTFESFAHALLEQVQGLIDAAPAFLRELDATLMRAAGSHLIDLPPFPRTALESQFTETGTAVPAKIIELVREWLTATRVTVEKCLHELLDEGFTARHSFGLEEVLPALEHLEAAYMELRGETLSVPTPFSTVDKVSPVEFLLLLQDPLFIERWNRSVVHQVARSMTPRMRRRITAQIDQARDLLLREWDQKSSVLEERVRESWNDMQKQQASRREISWPLNWTLAHLPGVLASPARYISDRRFSAPEPNGVSLLIEPDTRSLLMPYQVTGLNAREAWFRIPMYQLAELLRQEALRLWEEDRAITIGTSQRRAVYRRVAAAAVLTAAAGGGWLAAFGTDTLSLSLLPFMIATQTGASWHWIDRFVSRSGSSNPEEHAQVIHETVRRLLIDYTNRIQYRLDDLMQDEAYMAETEQRMLPARNVAQVHIPYRELIARLQKISTRGVTNRKYVAKRCVQTPARAVEAVLETKLLVNP